MATVNKDFRVKHGLIVEGTTGTINGSNILTTANDTGDLTEGANLYFTDARAKTSAADLLTNATLTNIQITGDGSGLTITAENGVADSTTDDLVEGLTNLYFTNSRAVSAIEAATLTTLTVDDITLDGATINVSELSINGAAGTITGAGSINLVTGDAQFNGETIATQAYADQAEADAINSSNNYTDSLIGDVTVDGTAGNTVTDRIATAVANLVDTAPETLDTLNELAAALGDDPNFVTTVTTSIGEKVAKAGDTMTGFLTLHADPTSNLHAATKQYVDAVSTTVSNLTTDDIAEGTNLYFTDQRAVDALEAVVPNFTEVDINSVAKQVAASGTLFDGTTRTVYSFDSTVYRSAKFLVKAALGSHTEVSEVLITLDTSDNVAITEYAIVGTNGNIVDITAEFNPTDNNIDILCSAPSAGGNDVEVVVAGTLLIA